MVDGHVVVVEDDGVVAWAYLLDGSQVVSDVWLYNRPGAAPRAEGETPEGRPCSNPLTLTAEVLFPPIHDPSEITLEWIHGPHVPTSVVVSIRNQKHAVLVAGVRPGWCRLSTAPGPCAQPLDEVVIA
jgi:hypothetical protein